MSAVGLLQQPADAGESYYTVAQAARTLQVHRSTITRWIKDGRLRAYRVGPKAVRIKESDLQRMITSADDPGKEAMDTEERQTGAFAGYLAPAPLSDEAIERMLEDHRRFRERVLAELEGKVALDSTEIVREEREERSNRLAGL